MSDEAVVEFATGYDFPLDDFQLDGIRSLLAGRSTLVAAPTGSGKTVIGEFAVWQALQRGGKCFYTTPLKALSNQKFSDLGHRHGGAQVGLLTGDNTINGDAPVVVMTTEVLRNMLYERSSTLQGLQFVVLDEVHFLADRTRGAVWEEVIIQLPPDVQLACLSATVSNAEEFASWLRSVRTSCDVVITDRRPVPLDHHYAVADRIHPMFAGGATRSGKSPRTPRQPGGPFGTPNPEVVMLERRASNRNRVTRRGRRVASGPRLRPPRRSDVVHDLRQRRWLPAIYFLFSRAGCDAAVRQLLSDGVRLTTQSERATIREVVAEHTAEASSGDLEVLGASAWAEALEHGIASHHAGLIPMFKEAVEELFVAGLVQVCFATETLALGVNMPARTVVIERLEKWDGEQHRLLTPGQFTQLTGRAGRRGLDTRGHAVVLYQRDLDFHTVASLVGRRTEPLTSQFAPSYNMAVNLLRRHDREQAERLLARSFAQFQADARVGNEDKRIAENRQALEGYAANLHSDRGDFGEYWALRCELSRLESAREKNRRQRRHEAIEQAVAALREGDVVALPGDGAAPDLAAVVDRSTSKSGTPLARVVTEDRRLTRIGPREFDRPPERVGRVDLPGAGGPRKAAWRKQVAAKVRALDITPRTERGREPAPVDEDAARIAALREAIHAHPVHQDPQLPEVEVWAHRYDDLLADTHRLERRVRRQTGSLVRTFERILGVLADLEYLSGARDLPRPTARGLLLARLYSETDLVVAEALRAGALDNLDPAELAAVASTFTHESRQKEPPPPTFPTRAVREAVGLVVDLWEAVAAREAAADLPVTRRPDPGITDIVWRWAAGADFDDALGTTDLPAGDFVRNIKQVADLLRQVRDADRGPVGSCAREANRALVRGVVAYTGLE